MTPPNHLSGKGQPATPSRTHPQHGYTPCAGAQAPPLLGPGSRKPFPQIKIYHYTPSQQFWQSTFLCKQHVCANTLCYFFSLYATDFSSIWIWISSCFYPTSISSRPICVSLHRRCHIHASRRKFWPSSEAEHLNTIKI